MDFSAWRYRRFHTSYLLAWLGAGLLFGLVVSREQSEGLPSILLLVGLVLTLGAFRSQRWWAVPAIVLAGLAFGALRGSNVAGDYMKYEQIINRPVILKGVMSGDPQVANNGKQNVTLSKVSINEEAYPGEVFVTVFGSEKLKRGDTVVVRGVIRGGFASFGAAISNGRLESVQRPNDLIRDIRERFAHVVRELVMEPMASLGLGFVVGQRSTLPDTLDEQLKVVGLTHIVVASGYNLTILVRFMMRLLARYSRYLAFAGSLVMILGFVLFSGLSPSMNRAVIVTVLSLLAWYVGRRFHPVLLIIYVASMTAVFNPMYVWSDLGWYLSFFAFAGILIVAPLVMTLLYKRRQPSSFEQLVVETLSAEVAALPLVVLAFSTVPVFALIANVLVAPFIPAAMILAALTGVIGMLSLTVATVVALPATVLIGYMVAVVEWLGTLPSAQYTVDFGIWPVLTWYGMMIATCIVIQRRTRYNFRLRDARLEA